MLTIGTVVLGVADLRRAAAFWMQALHYVPRADQDPDDPTWTVLVPAEGSGTPLALGFSETPVQEHPRVHLDLYPADADFVVLADTEGNRFCVIDTGHN